MFGVLGVLCSVYRRREGRPNCKVFYKIFLYVACWSYIIINKAPVHPNTPVWYPCYLLQENQLSLACCRISIWHLQVLSLLVKLICSSSVAQCAEIQTTWHRRVNCRGGLSKEQQAGELLHGESFTEKRFLYTNTWYLIILRENQARNSEQRIMSKGWRQITALASLLSGSVRARTIRVAISQCKSPNGGIQTLSTIYR